MTTYNRRDYTELSLPRLLDCEGDFSVWIWDNGSTDGSVDLVRSMESHPRVGRVFLSADNVMQAPPFQWVVDGCDSPIVGRVDNDCLMPACWIEPISQAVCEQDRLGAIGCWLFWPEDFDESVGGRKIRRLGKHQVVTNAYNGGTGFLIRKELCHRYWRPFRHDIPLDQMRMSADGLVNGWYYPLIWAEHMDDPRSSHCALKRPDGMSGTFALTAKRRDHETPEQYERWIREDCAKILSRTTEEQLRAWRRSRLRSAPRRAARAAKRFVRRAWGKAAS